MDRKHGWQKRFFALTWRLQRREQVYIALPALAQSAGTSPLRAIICSDRSRSTIGGAADAHSVLRRQQRWLACIERYPSKTIRSAAEFRYEP